MDDKIKDITQISKDKEVITLVNVEPSNQERLIKILEKATEDVMQHLAGFVSANIHRSLDGTKVVNYAQWKNRPLRICYKILKHKYT